MIFQPKKAVTFGHALMMFVLFAIPFRSKINFLEFK
jgi:hypothetical protein